MFRWHGLLGALMIAFAELNFIFKIEPFASYYFPIIWIGFILLVDAIVYKLRKHSLLHNDMPQFLFLMALSVIFWWIFEIINYFVGNWYYVAGGQTLNLFTPIAIIKGTIAFSTVLPGFFETYELYKTLHLFSDAHLKRKYKITKMFLFTTIGFGVFSLFAPIVWPAFFFPLVWGAFFFLLDPINYLHGQPSIIGHLEDKKLQAPVTLMLTGITLGFLWEFWNFWSTIKWVYLIPHFGFLKIFEMPLLGWLGYLPFALSLYAMYYFACSLFRHKGHLLEHKF